MKPLRVVIALALTAAAVRLLPLQWLHPLHWDEIEYFRATLWVAEGRVPFRDFWEHHAPLHWFVFAPFAALTSGGGAETVIFMRWVQMPFWIATFWLLNVWMRNAGLDAFARWAAMAIALGSSFFMIPAVEYRPDALACLLFAAGLVLAQKGTARAAFAAGVVFCLSEFVNMRMGPLLVLTFAVLLFVDPRERRWRPQRRLFWMIAGGFAALAVCMAYFAATGTVDDLYHGVIRQNYLADKFSADSGPLFLHRLLVPFGVRILGSPQLFDWQIVDLGGIAVIFLTIAGFAIAIRRWREPDALFVMAFIAAVNIAFIAPMKFVWIYHFLIAVILGIPLMALVISRMPRHAVLAIAAIAWCVHFYGAVFRGKEHDLAYQDRIMTEVHARSNANETVWSGGPWPVRRESPYRIWFLHEIARALLRLGQVEPYRLEQAVANPPALIVFDHNTHRWLVIAQHELAPFFVRHYTPVWRNLWVPGMNAVVASKPQGWIVPRDGVYRLFASEELVNHAWFRYPLEISAFEQRDAKRRFEVRLPAPSAHPALDWRIDGQPAVVGPAITLKKGQKIAVANRGAAPLAVFLLQGNDAAIFRQPPPGVTLEASSTRVTHVPEFGARIE